MCTHRCNARKHTSAPSNHHTDFAFSETSTITKYNSRNYIWKKPPFCILYWRIHIITYPSKPAECTAARVNPNVKCGLGVITMCQCRFVDCNKGTTLAGMLMGGVVHVCGEGVFRNCTFCSVLLSQKLLWKIKSTWEGTEKKSHHVEERFEACKGNWTSWGSNYFFPGSITCKVVHVTFCR